MKTLTIDLDNWEKSKLLIGYYVELQSLYENTPLTTSISTDSLQCIEAAGYIKILDLHSFIYEPREKLIQLFAKSEKNIEAIEILNHLNQKIKSKSSSKRGFDVKSPSNLKFVNARLKSGYSKDDLIKVIDKKFKDWWGTNMQSYLRPETLFNETKFQGYINEIGEDATNTYNPIELC